MMRTCDACGMGDDSENMYYVQDDDLLGAMQCVCEFCLHKKPYKNISPVIDVVKALSRERASFSK